MTASSGSRIDHRQHRPAAGDTAAKSVCVDGGEYELYWPAELSGIECEQLLFLYDEVARNEATHGFSGAIDNEVGRGIVRAEAESLSAGQILMLLARDSEGIVGSLVLQPYTSHSRKHTLAAKRAVAARRSRGTFFPLMADTAIERAVAIGAEVITCEVAADGPLNLWKSWGFIEYGVMPDYARRHGKSLHGHFLYLPLAAKCSSA
ncbi:MAG: hypothetical protein K0U80_02550 [Actinomycetia bacterium]|nr:hypothetical protein [Actinomycetes bacterium]MCH9761999.1 hypothetical protein [Actinomycetes bacterium]